MKRLFLLSFLFTQFLFAGYHTPNENVIWNFDSLVAHSNGVVTGSFPSYSVNDTITISPNDLLVVQAGSVVTLSQTSIVVDGAFRAIGNANAMIRFTGTTPSPASWKELRFEDSTEDFNHVLSYCNIEYADKSIN